jgi:hypothetical protein
MLTRPKITMTRRMKGHAPAPRPFDPTGIIPVGGDRELRQIGE